MAEIHIERKTGVWHWIGALVLVLLLGWTVFAVMQKRAGTEGTPAVTAPAGEPGAQDAAGTSVDATAQPSPPPADDSGAPPPQ